MGSSTYQARKELEAVHLEPRLETSFDLLPGMLSPAEAFLAPIGAISTVPYSKRLLKDYA